LAQVPECCNTCTCTLCGDLASCQASPFVPETKCNQWFDDDPSGEGCGLGATPCEEWYDNTSVVDGGVTVDSYSSTSGTNPCIPIDGGLGFLIAGGIGMGVVGIRRRKGELELKRA
jgi:hypothetical protein